MIRRSFACAIVRKIHADMFLGAPKDEDNANERRLEMELYLIDVLEMKMMVTCVITLLTPSNHSLIP